MDSVSDSSYIPENWKTKLVKERKLKSLSYLEELVGRFSPSERLLLYAFTTILAISTFILLLTLNSYISVVIPAPGGSLTEGEVGRARFINPILTLSQSDQDIAALVYSGLMRALPDGEIVPDLASSYQISADGTTYTFKLKPNLTFHDGTPLTASDVLFTVKAAQNPDLKSTHRADWEGVSVSSPSPDTIVFTLPHPYAPFIDNTTLGILPAHLWENIAPDEFAFDQLNTHPVGSGPYKIENVETDKTGSVTRYDLVPFSHEALGVAHIGTLSFVFYQDEKSLIDALNAGEIDTIANVAASDLASVKRNDTTAVSVPLPRVFGVFFNQSHAPALADLSAREALDAAVDKQAVVKNVLDGYGIVLNGPIPPEALDNSIASSTPVSSDYAQAARTILQNGGWKWNPSAPPAGEWQKGKLQLDFSIATADVPELVETANQVAANWRAAGIQVTVKIYPLSELNTNVLRPRAYDAVLFGEVVGRDLDLFAFWHSSQRNDPGLNLAMYANATTDSLLSQARAESDMKKRAALYQQFAALVENDHPAVFLYSPEFIYIVPTSLQGIRLGALNTPADRFENVYQWYTDTQRVWTLFSKNY